jgi:hypothetical protein
MLKKANTRLLTRHPYGFLRVDVATRPVVFESLLSQWPSRRESPSRHCPRHDSRSVSARRAGTTSCRLRIACWLQCTTSGRLRVCGWRAARNSDRAATNRAATVREPAPELR